MRLEIRDDHGRIVAQIDAHGHFVGTVAPYATLETASIILHRALARVAPVDVALPSHESTHRPFPPTDLR